MIRPSLQKDKRPKAVNRWAFEEGTQPVKEAMRDKLYLSALPNCNSCRYHLHRGASVCRPFSGNDAFCQGLETGLAIPCSWIPETDNESKSHLKASPSVDGGTQQELINLLAPAKKLFDEARLTKYPLQ